MNPSPAKSQTPAYTRELVDFVHAISPANLPDTVLDRARYFLLDYLAVAIRGSQEDSARSVQRMIERSGVTGRATVAGTSLQSSPSMAALANGTSSHGIEMDDTHSGGSIHLGTTMFPVALALSEITPETTSEDLLAAVVAGYETAARVAMAARAKEQYRLGFHPTQTCGVFGAAVTASKLLGLEPDRMQAALGIAGSMAAGSMEFLADGAWTKRIHPGLAARNGIEAALLAAEGFVAPRTIFEGRDGFLHAYSRDPLPGRLTDGIGASYEILHTAVKPHACCRYMQGPIDAVLSLMREGTIDVRHIAGIEIAVLEAGWGIVCEPREKKYRPESVVDAQFSMPFGAAVAACRGKAGLDEFTMAQIAAADIQRMMRKVALVRDPGIEKSFPLEWPARVVITFDDGSRREKFVQYPKGDPQNPLTWNEMIDKFRSLAGTVLSAQQCSRIIEAIAAERPSTLAALTAGGSIR